MNTREKLQLMSKLISISEGMHHLGGDPTQPTREEASRTGLGRVALSMEPPVEDVPVTEDSVGDATSGLQRDVALAMNKGGIPAPAGAVPSENNPALMGTQNPNDVVTNKSLYAQAGSTQGMNLPADQRGGYAPMTGKSMGVAPDGPDLRTITSEGLKKLYTEQFGGYGKAVTRLVKTLRVGIMEADTILNSEVDLTGPVRQVMVDELKTLGFNESKEPEKWVSEAITSWKSSR